MRCWYTLDTEPTFFRYELAGISRILAEDPCSGDGTNSRFAYAVYDWLVWC